MAQSQARSGATGAPTAVRRTPKQRRSREIVEAIVEAGRRILEERGADALTTNHVAERAGVSIGSLYRYFPNRAAVLAAIYDRDATREARELAHERWAIADLPLEQALETLVDFQLERHRRLLEMESSFYRSHHGEFGLSDRIGAEAVVEGIRAILAAHATRVRARDLDEAAYLIARGVSGVLRLTLEERPEKLSEPSFRDELLDLVTRYVVADALPR